MKRVVVIGCGIIGLTTAIRLREAGFDAHIIAKGKGPDTASAVAAAMWEPFMANPRDKILNWAAEAYRVFRDHAELPESGVDAVVSRNYLRVAVEKPFWHGITTGFKISAYDAPHDDGTIGEFEYQSYMADMSLYLPYLERVFVGLGGTITIRALESIDDAFDGVDAVVNCSGLGARELANDPTVEPARGVIVLAEPKITHESISDDDHPLGMTYIFQRRYCLVLGGLYEKGKTDMTVSQTEIDSIVARASAVRPAIAQTQVIGARVGLRPARPEIRLEADAHARGRLIHNYGHGGSGITVSWGCARDVVNLMRA